MSSVRQNVYPQRRTAIRPEAKLSALIGLSLGPGARLCTSCPRRWELLFDKAMLELLTGYYNRI